MEYIDLATLSEDIDLRNENISDSKNPFEDLADKGLKERNLLV